jgi:hypothetical protein
MSVTGGPNIVEDGLVLLLDVANPDSYPGSGNIFFDISKYKNNGQITNNLEYITNTFGDFLVKSEGDCLLIRNVLSGDKGTISIYSGIQEGLNSVNYKIGLNSLVSNNLNLGEVNNVCITWNKISNSVNRKIFINGSFVTQSTLSQSYNINNSNIKIKSKEGNKIKYILKYSIELSEAEILQNHNAVNTRLNNN